MNKRKTRPFTEKGFKEAESLTKGMNSPLIKGLNISLSRYLLVMLMTLLPSSIEGLMGLWEEHLVSHPSFKGLDTIRMKVPYTLSPNESGSLSHSTAHQMRDVVPNRWWEL